MTQLIDAGVFIDLERRQLSLDVLASVEEPLAIASITASELLVGVHRADSEPRRELREAFVEAILRTLPVLPFDLPVARTHAQLGTALAGMGQPIGPHDLLVAATALTHRCAVLTFNRREFARVPGLSVHQPSW